MENNINTIEITLIQSIEFFNKAADKAALSGAGMIKFAGQPTLETEQSKHLRAIANDLQNKLILALNMKCKEAKLGTLPGFETGTEERLHDFLSRKIVDTPITVTKPTEVENTVEEPTVPVEDTTMNVVKPTIVNFVETVREDYELKSKFASLWPNDKSACHKLYHTIVGHDKTHVKEMNGKISAIVAEFKKSQESLKQQALKDEVEKTDIKIGTSIEKSFSGEELVKRGSSYLKDGNFNILVLTGEDDEKNVNAEDLIKLQAKQLKASGQEGLAVEYIQTLFKEKGFDKEMARQYLYKLMAQEGTKELSIAIKNLLQYGETKKSGHESMLSHCNNLVTFYTRKKVRDDEVPVMKDGKPVEGKSMTIPVYESWDNKRVQSFVDKCITDLINDGILPKKEVKAATTVTVEQTTTENKTSVLEQPIMIAEKPKKLSKAEKKQLKLAEKQKTTIDTPATVIETESPIKKKEEVVATQESSTGHSDYMDNYLKTIYFVKADYAKNNSIGRDSVMRLNNYCKPMWIHPRYWNNFDKKQLAEIHTRTKLLLTEMSINPSDFIVHFNQDGQETAIRVVNMTCYFPNRIGEWKDKNGRVLVVNPENTLTETTESSKKDVAPTSPQSVDKDLKGAGQSKVNTNTQHKVIDVKDGVKAIEHPATTKFKEILNEKSTDIVAFVKKTRKAGYEAWVTHFKGVRIKWAATIEAAQEKLTKAIENYNKNTKPGEKQIPTQLEFVEVIEKPSELAKAV